MKHYKSVEFLSIFRMSSPPHKRKAPLLKTFWRRFCGSSSQFFYFEAPTALSLSLMLSFYRTNVEPIDQVKSNLS